MRAALAILLALLPGAAAAAFALDLPANARQTAAEQEADASLRLPISPWQNGDLQAIRAEGALIRQAWEIVAPGLTTLQILRPLRDQLGAAGFDVLFECEAQECGGFEFRYAIEVLDPPEMFVDLGDFRYLAAQRSAAEAPEYISLLVSRAPGRGFVQLTRIGPAGPGETPLATAGQPPLAAGGSRLALPVPQAAGELTGLLQSTGRAVLPDVAFATGSAELGPGPLGSLAELAGFLAARPEAQVVLVGHTDAEGSLAGNIALSRERAEAVLRRLAERHGIAPARMAAEGVGFLAPLTTNATEAGRTLNRRVEAVLKMPG